MESQNTFRENQTNSSNKNTSFFRPVIQKKLSVGSSNDRYETEADHVADKVIQMKNTSSQNFAHSGSMIQKKCAHCEEEERKIQTKSLAETIQKNAKALSESSIAPSHIENNINRTRGKGNMMDGNTKDFMESRFGADFSGVKIHTGNEAVQMSRELHAHAFTVGNDIYFNEGKYNPETDSGKHLLAHELTHTIQQNGGIGRKIQKVDDATAESGTGVDQGITNGTMIADAIMGNTYTANCRLRNYSMRFKFSKAYKGTYPYRAASRDVKGVYVKIEASIADNQYCGRCTPMKLIQTLRNITQNSSGNMETADPTDATRRERSGWSDASAPSRGWRVDTLTTSANPYYTSTWVGQEGSETSPAILWDVPGDWSTDTNVGKEFYTCAVCTDVSGRNWISACVQWGYYINSSGDIAFRPITPVATCSYTQQVRDVSERWDSIAGNTKTNITF
ncbi:eCIS core domain-containing protein [Chryseobacterium oryctis]|uniref:DUF4157 domain-containing protein n=1 Tax=Chryseobacterium oryctis TaxID=2952618 RepID=A0ABT3HRN0_9FLAO|nr:DUF4157 domain-containing protein [Chryseobacterium oryctis]MCW3162443.1 DUF4157 domain-containing protein [Chryseobacterium oryctis]